MPKNRLIFLAIIIVVVLVVGVVIFLNRRPSATMDAVTLSVWGTDPKDMFEPLITQYNAVRPNVTIKYSEISPANYEDILVKGFAAGQGPDVFMIGNHDIKKYKYLIAPPDATQISASTLDREYPKAVTEDLLSEGEVLAMPLYIDTLALVYNRDMLDQIGKANPPATWQEVVDVIPELRKINSQGQITTAAIALGGTEGSVRHATDILNLIMLQNGTVMNTADERAAFGQSEKALDAFRFYMDFSNPSANTYTWNESLGQSEESFLAGKTAMILAYKSDTAGFKARNPFLNFSIAPVPQISGEQNINYPSYQGLTVWKQSPVAGWGWDFAIWAASDTSINKPYLEASGRSPALRELISSMSNDPSVGMFAKQSLTARSWHMPDYSKVKEIFSSAIQSILRGEKNLENSLQGVEKQINSL